MTRLRFPWWVRLHALTQQPTNSGLTRAEEHHLARRYRRGAGRTPTRREAREMRAALDARRSS